MHSTVFRIAIAVIVAGLVMFLLAVTFGELEQSSNTSVSTMERARRTGLNKSVQYLQQ